MIKSLDDLKIQFVVSVYETITRQIQHADIKTSILISWDGAIAVMLGREIAEMTSRGAFSIGVTALAISVAVGLIASGISVYQILRPRSPGQSDPEIASEPGLLYAGDILKLGKTPTNRMKSYLEMLVGMEEPGQIYSHYVKSIVLVADIAVGKNRRFVRALLASTIAFCLLAVLIAVLGVEVPGK